ncbi:ABC transporter ATP-binding protein [Lentilitoribacter sp. EG35]|uniref:ABC transporter ATP-binding protein n=1 Tax=Lentilitoribacter sp. EG35 TaxID=3234192 RepID=UPI00345FBB42
MMNKDGLILHDLVKSFDDQLAVDDISLNIPKGKLTVLLGPSGCGKSTLLRMIAGFEAPDRGKIYIGEKQIDILPSSMRDISMVFQSYALFPHMSVADNILFGLQVRKTSNAEQAERLQKVSQLMGLTELQERKPSQLSGGQQQRVALARAVISERPVCLMDEPLSNLDAKLRHEMRTEIRRLQQQLKLTMVYVTHDQVEAITMADQIVLINKGRIEQVGSPKEIYSQPASVFAARFIGSPPMNLIPALDMNSCTFPNGEVPLPDDIICGVRPEDFEISSDSGFEVEILDIEYQGADQLLSCQMGAATIDVRLPARLAINIENKLKISWQKDASHFFNEQTGQRIELPSILTLSNNLPSNI